jgi:aryl-alcohol dehydrogenase-like predicted oxidoreductase
LSDDYTAPPVRLGHTDIEVSPVGLGCMGMSQSYGPADPAEATATLRAAVDLGVRLFDSSDVYGAAGTTPDSERLAGFGHNEKLIGQALESVRDQVVLATKFGVRITDEGRTALDGRPEYVGQACEASLRRLHTDHIDLYYVHRLDPAVPIEDPVGAMAELVAEGKVRAIGLSEIGPDLLRRAAAVHPVSALQSEYSLWERAVEADIVPACRELGVTLVPYSPLGRAMLAGRFTATDSFADDDFRSTVPKFAGENFVSNLELIEELRSLAEAHGCTVGQLALAWLLGQPLPLVPIPGTKRVRYLQENVAAARVRLEPDDVERLSCLFDPAAIRGARYGRIG